MPQLLHTVTIPGGKLQALGAEFPLNPTEAILEFAIRRLKGALGVDVQITRHIRQREQQIAEFLRGRGAIIDLHGRAQLTQLLIDLREQPSLIRPVEADARHLGRDTQSFQKSGQRRRHAGQ